MPWVRFALLTTLAGLAGCRARVADPGVEPEIRLGDHIDISLADWLKQPRAQLAKLCDEMASNVEKQQDFTRTNVETLDLLPNLHAPILVPIFARCTFSEAQKLSLPPYRQKESRDDALALHLARHGDREAALQLAGPDDKVLLSEIDAWRTERNYPLEWTRLVALTLQSAQFKIAHGQIEGATELVLLHKQLREILDAKAATGPLGADLLPLGRQALQQAGQAWREAKEKRLALAADIDAALAEWGEVPAPVAGLSAHAPKEEIARVLDRQPEGRAFVAATPEAVQRALDLFALPVPAEGANAVVAFLDPRDRLDEVLVLYKPKINEHFPEPIHLAHYLLEHGLTSSDRAVTPGQVRQTFDLGGLRYDVTLFTLSNDAGATVRVAATSRPEAPQPAVFARDPRDFGAVHLDRSFSSNRLRLDPFLGGDLLESEKKAVLDKIVLPVSEFAPSTVLLQRQRGHDLVASLTVRWPADLSGEGLYRLGLPLWAAYGKGVLESIEDLNGGCLTLTWQDATTRIQLLLPNTEHPPELVAEDARGSKGLAARAEAAARKELEDRQARLAAGKPDRRLARTLPFNPGGTNGLHFEGLQLGLSRPEALATLPNSQALRRQTLRDGLAVLFLDEPPPTATYWARQAFLRFGPGDRLAELRIRYQEGPAHPTAKAPSLLDELKRGSGAPEELPAPWAGLWAELGASGRVPTLYRWVDDVTLLTLQRDDGGVEVTLRDCPPDRPTGVDLPPLQFCSRGVEACALGDSRTEVLHRYHVSSPHTLANGADVLPEPETSPYDVLLIWYEQGRISRIVARHRGAAVQPATAAAALQAAWSQNIDTLGYVRRTEGHRGQVYAAYGWHDDVTRVRTFAQDTEEGVRLFTEFRDWPVVVKSVAATARPDPLP
jgi:hypothetical protein